MVTATVASSSQKMLLLNIKKSLLDEYKYDVLKILLGAFGVHMYGGPLFQCYLFFLECVTSHRLFIVFVPIVPIDFLLCTLWAFMQ